MYYDTLSRNTVKIVLTRGDMDRYSLESASLRARSAESKRSLTVRSRSGSSLKLSRQTTGAVCCTFRLSARESCPLRRLRTARRR